MISEKKRLRYPEIHGHAKGVLVGSDSSNPLRLPSKTQFVAQSDRSHLRYHSSKALARWKLHLCGRPRIATPGIHGILQRHDGPPIRMDLHGQAGTKRKTSSFRRTTSTPSTPENPDTSRMRRLMCSYLRDAALAPRVARHVIGNGARSTHQDRSKLFPGERLLI